MMFWGNVGHSIRNSGHDSDGDLYPDVDPEKVQGRAVYHSFNNNSPNTSCLMLSILFFNHLIIF